MLRPLVVASPVHAPSHEAPAPAAALPADVERAAIFQERAGAAAVVLPRRMPITPAQRAARTDCPTEATGQGNADQPLPNYKRSQMTPAIGCTLPTPQCGWGRCTRSVVCAAQRSAVRAVACAHVRGCVRGAECARGARVAAPRAASAKALDRRAVRCQLRVARRIFVSPEAIGGRRQSLLERLARHAVYPLAPAAAPAVAFGKVVANVRLRPPRCVRRLHVAAATMPWDITTCVARAPRGGCYRRTFHRSTAARDRSTAGACL